MEVYGFTFHIFVLLLISPLGLDRIVKGGWATPRFGPGTIVCYPSKREGPCSALRLDQTGKLTSLCFHQASGVATTCLFREVLTDM
jgi:hypothetical protein